MKQLALVTVRLEHAGMARLERARDAVADRGDRADVFTFTTCQRTLACTLAADPAGAAGQLAQDLGLPEAERFTGLDAFAHLATVAASLAALVPGEDQVPGQFRQALADAEDELATPLVDRLREVRALARQARDAGDLQGHRGGSVVDLARPLLPEEGPVAVLGTGTIARDLVDRLDDDRRLHVVSRSRERAVELAAEPGLAWSRAAFLSGPPSLAGLVLSTRAPEDPLLDEAGARRLVETRASDDPLAVVDLGTPRNADPALRRLANLELADLEDLAHRARARPCQDERIRAARAELERSLARRRRRRRTRTSDERVVALRQALADELTHLADELPIADDEDPAWLDQLHGRLAHTSQAHLEAALQGDPPP